MIRDVADQLSLDYPGETRPGEGMPCSVLVARVLRRLTGDDSPRYFDGSEWWQDVNVWDPARPWSMIDAVEAMEPHLERTYPGRVEWNGVLSYEEELPTPQDWFAVQGWRELPDPELGISGSGHQVLLRWVRPLQEVEVIHSSEELGLRFERYQGAEAILSQFTAGAIGVPLWVHDRAKERPMTTRRARLTVPDEPLITDQERDDLLDFAVEQVGKTAAQVKSGQRFEASDAAEIALDLGILLASALVGGPAGAVIGTVAPMAKDLVVNAVEAAEARNRTVERLRARAERADASADEHIVDAEALQASEEREFLERFRIRIHLRRARALQAKADRLDAEADALERASS